MSYTAANSAQLFQMSSPSGMVPCADDDAETGNAVYGVVEVDMNPSHEEDGVEMKPMGMEVSTSEGPEEELEGIVPR